jgi:hypothetical protein
VARRNRPFDQPWWCARQRSSVAALHISGAIDSPEQPRDRRRQHAEMRNAAMITRSRGQRPEEQTDRAREHGGVAGAKTFIYNPRRHDVG